MTDSGGGDDRASGIVVRVAHDDDRGDSATTLPGYAQATGASGLAALLAAYGHPPSRRAVQVVAPASVRGYEHAGAAADDIDIDLPSLNQYWHIDATSLGESALESFLAQLRELVSVGHAYRELTWSEPVLPWYPCADPSCCDQVYLDDVAVAAARTWPGGRGEGVAIADIETAWWLDDLTAEADHQELTYLHAGLVHGVNGAETAKNHGTAVLGILAAADDGHGLTGIAPGLRTVVLASALASNAPGRFVADALFAVLEHTRAGDVIVVEQQVNRFDTRCPGLCPAEVDEATFLALRVAANNWRIVIEPAGNGNHDLDAIDVAFPLPGQPANRRPLDPHAAGFVDSRAILVTGCQENGDGTAAGAFERSHQSNFGRRVDCVARASGIVTLGYNSCSPDPLRPRQAWYSHGDLGNTSSAAAIVAGLAALVQGVRLAAGHPPLNWAKMRHLLSQFGTPLAPSSDQLAGAILPRADAIRLGKPAWF